MPSLSELAELREDWIDDFALNQTSRRKFREEKKEIIEKKKVSDSLLEKSCLPKGWFGVDHFPNSNSLQRIRRGK